MAKNIEEYYKYNTKKTRGIVPDISFKKQFYEYCHLLGYVILSFTVLDYLVILTSLDLSDSTWKLDTIGKIIEQSYISLLGFILIFFRSPEYFIKQNQLRIISRLSKVALYLGIIYFLFVPLVIINSTEIININKTKINIYLDSLDKNSIDNSSIKNNLNLNLDKFPSNKKQEQLNIEIDLTEELTKEKVKEKLVKNKNFILKMTLKWLIGTVIAGASFIQIWRYTKWARTAISNIDKHDRDYT